ncbi:hypothetical protein C463_09434 [Halorubrum californiense DSM 19288]|uniref:Uncharacterized protein n=1 Tax=Halorubrum californiense DSM 19288 TaxID=1227465 RepID=M0EAG2_9EURY|nr:MULTISPECIES: hypothetical protein [Halorubrum]ELZ43877.1 hypothetical protein C463_09434 [Halorubrum californiense DSM 19288]TKX71237.1 hypothetical protein EXE40_07800 [Halorubrum sp. GN11GM_10-3_MGM]
MRALPIAAVAALLLVAPVAGVTAPGAVPQSADSAVSVDSPLSADSAVSAGSPQSAGSEPTATGETTPQIDTTNLTLRTLSTPRGAATRVSGYTRGPDIGSSLGFATADADAAFETAAVVDRIERAEAGVERQQQILAEINRVERAEVALSSRQSNAFSAHAAGEISDRELVDELVRVAATAREYDERLDAIDALAESTDGFSSPGRLDELQVALQVYEGPVRDHALATARGQSSPNELYVASSQGAVVLATVVDGEYVREVFRTDRWDRGGSDISNDAAIEITEAAYPETAALREPDAFGAGSVQRITIPHEIGTLRTFVSGGTEQAFVEHQRINLSAFPDTEPVAATGDGFNVTVERTYAGGPVTVTVLDDETGEPVPDVTVTKSVGGNDSQSIGTTNEAGVVRTLSPAETYRITVVDEPRVVVLGDIEPLPTPRPVDDE